MRRAAWLAVALALLMFAAVPVQAYTGRVLLIVCDKLGVAGNASAFIVNTKVMKFIEGLGLAAKCETISSADTAWVNSMYATDPVLGGTGSRYGRYDLAIMLNFPSPAWIDTDAKCVTYNMPHFAQWIDRNSARAFPIPLIVPISANVLAATNDFAAAYTGQISAGSAGSATSSPYENARGDSLYLYNYVAEGLVATADTFSWCQPIMWRVTAAATSGNLRRANIWQTVGTGNHRIVWIPCAHYDSNDIATITAIAMYTRIQPVEIPIVGYLCGAVGLGTSISGADTTGYAAGLKAVVDYAVEQGMKLELSCFPYYMQSQAVTLNKTTIPAWASAYPNNIRLTMSSLYSWVPPAYYDMMGSVSNKADTSYAAKVNRIKSVQDSCGAYFPGISTTRLDVYSGGFYDNAGGKADSLMLALAARGVADIYDFATNHGTAYPASTEYLIIGPQRTWVGAANTELRFRPNTYIARYRLGNGATNADSLKVRYCDFPYLNTQRAQMITYALGYWMGTYTTTVANSQITCNTADNARLVSNHGRFGAGFYLPIFTASGGDKTVGTWVNSTFEAKMDSGRSLFLDCMKMLVNMKNMTDYAIDTYGAIDQSAFAWAWGTDVKYDRRNGNSFANSHVTVQ